MISEKEKVILKNLSVSSEWQVVEKLAKDMLDDIQFRPKIKDNEWDTLRSIIGDEGETMGIRSLIQSVHKMAKDAR